MSQPMSKLSGLNVCWYNVYKMSDTIIPRTFRCLVGQQLTG